MAFLNTDNGVLTSARDNGNGKPITDINIVGATTLKGAVVNIVTAGNSVQLPSYSCREVTVIAKKGNTGKIYVGGADVSSTGYGVELDANEAFTFNVINTNVIYIDASVSGEGISYIAL